MISYVLKNIMREKNIYHVIFLLYCGDMIL